MELLTHHQAPASAFLGHVLTPARNKTKLPRKRNDPPKQHTDPRCVRYPFPPSVLPTQRKTLLTAAYNAVQATANLLLTSATSCVPRFCSSSPLPELCAECGGLSRPPLRKKRCSRRVLLYRPRWYSSRNLFCWVPRDSVRSVFGAAEVKSLQY